MRKTVVAVPEINARDLQRRTRERRDRMGGAAVANDGITAVLARVYAYIQNAADENRSSCTFEVPMCVLGSAPYDLVPCIERLLASLKARGFTVDYVFPRTLFVYWHEVEDEPHPTQLPPHMPPQHMPPPHTFSLVPPPHTPPPMLPHMPSCVVEGGRARGRGSARGRGARVPSYDYRPFHEFDQSHASTSQQPAA